MFNFTCFGSKYLLVIVYSQEWFKSLVLVIAIISWLLLLIFNIMVPVKVLVNGAVVLRVISRMISEKGYFSVVIFWRLI